MNQESPAPPPLPSDQQARKKGPSFRIMLLAGIGIFLLQLVPFLSPEFRRFASDNDGVVVYSEIALWICMIGTLFFRGYRGLAAGFLISWCVAIFGLIAVCFGILAMPR
jgi:hypothetical protein